METKSRGVPRKILIFKLVNALENQTWYQTNAKILTFYLSIRYANYLIIIFMNINESIRNEKILENIIEGVPTKLLISQ